MVLAISVWLRYEYMGGSGKAHNLHKMNSHHSVNSSLETALKTSLFLILIRNELFSGKSPGFYLLKKLFHYQKISFFLNSSFQDLAKIIHFLKRTIKWRRSQPYNVGFPPVCHHTIFHKIIKKILPLTM